MLLHSTTLSFQPDLSGLMGIGPRPRFLGVRIDSQAERSETGLA
jgi:hypothetical protein